jgi:hypothetical protein
MPSPTLVVEDGSQVAGANSYITQANAMAYFINRGDTVFTSATSDQQITALVRAASGMDAWLTGRWYGRKASSTQSLDWPRREVRDVDGYRVASNVIPNKVQYAQAEVAKIEMTTPFIQQSVSKDDMVKSEVIGPINVTYKDNAPAITYWPQIIALLRDYALIGVMPIEVVIGITDHERDLRREAIYNGSMNPFDYPDFFHLIKMGSYIVPDQGGSWDNDPDWY